MREIGFKRHRFPLDVIRYAVWLDFRFTISLMAAVDAGEGQAALRTISSAFGIVPTSVFRLASE